MRDPQPVDDRIPPSGRLDLGRILERAFAVIGENLPALSILALVIVGIPSLILRDSLFAADVLEDGIWQGFELSSLVLMVAQAMLIAAVMNGVQRSLRGEPIIASTGTVLRNGVAAIWPVLGTSVLTGILIGIGYVFLIVPGLILSIVWFVAVPAAAIERQGVLSAMRRSAKLTRGQRWELFGLLFVLWIVATIAIWVLTFLFGIFFLAPLGRALATTAVAAVSAVISIIIYDDLRALHGEAPLPEPPSDIGTSQAEEQ